MPTHPNFGHIISRPSLHAALMEAVDKEKITIQYEAHVTKYSETAQQGIVEISSGDMLKADIVVAADGIHSKSWTLVSGKEPGIHPSGLAMFRSAFPLPYAMADASLRKKWMPSANEDKMGFFLAQGSFGIILFGQDKASWVWQHKDNPETSSESWAATLSAEDALTQLDKEGIWGDDLRAVIAATPRDHIVDWRLMRRDLKRTWTSPHGRLIQLGDAAHPYLPTTVNGGTQAIEDGASLAQCLRLAVDTYGVDAIPDGAKVHNTLRIDRVGAIEATGMQRTKKHHQIDFEAVKKNPELVRNEPATWQTQHDPQVYALEMFEKCFEALKNGTTFVNTNKPEEYKFEGKN